MNAQHNGYLYVIELYNTAKQVWEVGPVTTDIEHIDEFVDKNAAKMGTLTYRIVTYVATQARMPNGDVTRLANHT